MKKYIIGVIMVFLLIVVFTSVNLVIGADGEVNYVKLTMPNVTMPLNAPNGVVPYSDTFGKLTISTDFQLDDFPQPNEIGRDVRVPISIYYDIYTTGDEADVFIYETYVNGYAYATNDAVIYRDVYAYIPYSVEYLFTCISRGYASILDNLTRTFNQGFPTLPSSENVIDYVIYIGRGLFHSVQSVAITFDFIVFPINVMKGSFL